MDALTLRPAGLDDAEAIVDVHEASATAAYRHIFEGPFPREQARAIRREQLADGRGVVAEVDGRVVGFAIVQPDGELNGLYVRPEWWRHGIGSRLLAAVPDARTLSVLEENRIGRAFYERHGWEPDGTKHPGPEGAVELRYRRTPPELSSRWEGQAEVWARKVRHEYAGYSWYRERFLELLPPPAGRALDVGCGEGTFARELKAAGYDVAGIDVSPTMIRLAAEADPEMELRVADAAELPFEDESFGLVVALNSLMNVDRWEEAIAEAARVLTTGGRFCFCIAHPVYSAGRWQEDAFVIRAAYLDRFVYRDPFPDPEVELVNAHRPLEDYSRALEAAGLLVEAVREPADPSSRLWSRVPMFLYVRALKP